MGTDKRSGKKPQGRGSALPNISPTASLTECTGLAPTPPGNQEEMNSLQQLFSTELPGLFPDRDDA
jgi:hypothetical protein